jgi:hypothetical protein
MTPLNMATACPAVVATFDGRDLKLTLPSGRAINYPGARLVPNAKFENGDPDIEYMDNARGQWKPVRAWFGMLVENVVAGTARDLLAAALLRFDARGRKVVFHCHDEAVIEALAGSLSPADALAILIEPPSWATGLPLGGKAHRGPTYFEEPAKPAQPIAPTATGADHAIDEAVDAFIITAAPLPHTKEIEKGAEEDFLASLDNTTAPLTDLVTLPMDAGNHVSCPFHDDPNPSCSIYTDHFYCHACGARGDRLDWLTTVEGMTHTEAVDAIADWTGPAAVAPRDTSADNVMEKLESALSLWEAAGSLRGTVGERYLAETRGIDVSRLPTSINEVLRFHRWCPFGRGESHPCIIALMRDPVTDQPVGIHRIGVARTNGTVAKLSRKMLGRQGVVKLWPVDGTARLVIGEGIETVLAAATRISFAGGPLTPAWSAVNSAGIARLPHIAGIRDLIVLADNDAHGKGQAAAERCRSQWVGAGRTARILLPKHPFKDFNDVILQRKTI